MGTSTESLSAASPPDDRLPFAEPFVAATSSFSAGAWRLRAAKEFRRKSGMWNVWDGRNDVVADVYSEADARLIVSSKALLLACVKLLNILRPLAIDGRLKREAVLAFIDAIEVVRRTHLMTNAQNLEKHVEENIDLDPAFRTWCAQQYRTATAQGQYPPSRSELRERYLRGDR
ncbi:MAG TPA: hypothetical protein VJ833_10225 [Rhodanobacteraceae bacterium]|nr:hypothetical protein [Rhodanobacteraceae bacterium]